MLVAVMLWNCKGDLSVKDDTIYSAYKPVLMEKSRITTDLFMMKPRSKAHIVKTAVMGNYLLSVEFGLGFHIHDLSDKMNPLEKGFFQLPGCIDLEVNNNTIYANNLNDLLVIDMTDIADPRVINRQEKVFDMVIKAPDGLLVRKGLRDIPEGTAIISYEKL